MASEQATMQFGVLLPTREAVMSRWRDPAPIYQMAERAEELGFHSVWVGDSLTARPRVEALATLAAVGARTRRVRLGTSIFLAALRQPVMLAYQLASVDWLAGGRVDLGIGYGRPNDGAHELEYRHVGITAENRIKRSEEIVTVLRRLWREPVVDFSGRFHRVDRAGILPRPHGDIPIWFGGFTPAAITRAARIGDGFLFGAASRPMQALCEALGKALDAAGRPRKGFGVETVVSYADGPERWRSAAETWRKLGATHFSMRAMNTGAALMGEQPPGFTTPRQHIDALEPFIRAVRGV